MKRGARLWLAAGTLAASLAADAASVQVIGLGPDRAELVINATTVRNLRSGQESPEGVKLISASMSRAIVSVDGRWHELGLGQSTHTAVAIKADPRGHFVTTVQINGRPVQAVVDTGASTVALNAADAARLGVPYLSGRQVAMRTANGDAIGYLITLPSVRVGNITFADVEGVVMARQDSPSMVLLGMSFLNRVEMRRSGDTLTLIRRD